MSKSRGPRHRSRSVLKKRRREKGMPSLGRFLKEFEIGEKAVIKVEASVAKAQPPLRYVGKCGTIIGKRGKCYVLEINDGKKVKKIITSPIHLKRG